MNTRQHRNWLRRSRHNVGWLLLWLAGQTRLDLE